MLVLRQDLEVRGVPDRVDRTLAHAKTQRYDVHDDDGEPECGRSQQVVSDPVLGNLEGVERLIELHHADWHVSGVVSQQTV